MAEATTYKDSCFLTHPLRLLHPSFGWAFVHRAFLVAVRKSFLVWFHGFMNFLNSGLLRLGFWGRVCCELVSAKLDRILRRCDGDHAGNASDLRDGEAIFQAYFGFDPARRQQHTVQELTS